MTTNRKTALNIALLVLRIGIGISFVFVYGYEKIFAGPETWTDLGGNMAVLGITFWPVACYGDADRLHCAADYRPRRLQPRYPLLWIVRSVCLTPFLSAS
ncbi:hypothetical protein [Longimonas sp.]|uniref:hypothetical protein n=1 Tax=Longimonas sp. TaxID=2039626 RepID=UPI003976A423